MIQQDTWCYPLAFACTHIGVNTCKQPCAYTTHIHHTHALIFDLTTQISKNILNIKTKCLQIKLMSSISLCFWVRSHSLLCWGLMQPLGCHLVTPVQHLQGLGLLFSWSLTGMNYTQRRINLSSLERDHWNMPRVLSFTGFLTTIFTVGCFGDEWDAGSVWGKEWDSGSQGLKFDSMLVISINLPQPRKNMGRKSQLSNYFYQLAVCVWGGGIVLIGNRCGKFHSAMLVLFLTQDSQTVRERRKLARYEAGASKNAFVSLILTVWCDLLLWVPALTSFQRWFIVEL